MLNSGTTYVSIRENLNGRLRQRAVVSVEDVNDVNDLINREILGVAAADVGSSPLVSRSS
jgi:hypothetical protein